jgi:ferredoxin
MTRSWRERRIDVDWTRCDGHGLCAVLFPEVIGSDEWGFPVIDGRPLSPDEIVHARRAIASCPALALRLETRSVKQPARST